MAAGDSSSRRKSSSSHKKKHVKTSSEVRKSKKRSRTGNKPKKFRRRNVSLSYSDSDSISNNSVSIPSTDSEDYRSRKARSRTRGDLKSRKRVRRSFSSHGGSRDSPCRVKRKESERNSASKARKKTQKRDHAHVYSKRDMNVNSKTSGSWSCSTCGSESANSEESDFSRGRSEKRGKKKKRSSSKMSNGKNKGRYRSRSCSSCSEYSYRSGYQSEDRWTGGNDLRRLKSVLADTNQLDEKEERDRSNYENEAEIIPAYDDCPSCRSNESQEGGRKKDSAQQPYISEKRWEVNKRDEEIFISRIGTMEETTKVDGVIDSTDSVMGCKNEGSSGIDIPGGDDLESLLRQKALENLAKFRQAFHSNKTLPNDLKDGNVSKQLSVAKVQSIQMDSHKDLKIPSTIERQSTRSSHLKVDEDSNLETVGIPTMEKNSIISAKNNGNSDGHGSKTKMAISRPVPDAGNSAIRRSAVSSKLTENNTHGAFNNKPSPHIPTSNRESSHDHKNLKQASTSLEFSEGNLFEAKSFTGKNVSEAPKAAFRDTNIGSVEVNTASRSTVPETSSLKPAIGRHGSDEPQGEAKDGSQYEQKTMSVMRGGEMVQVSYKVYIPKKTPALARRQLKR